MRLTAAFCVSLFWIGKKFFPEPLASLASRRLRILKCNKFLAKFFRNLNGNTKSAILVVTYVWRHTAHTWALAASLSGTETMSWTIILLRDKIKVEVPVSTIIKYVKWKSSRGERFQVIKHDDNKMSAFYAYRDTFYARMGYLTTFANELTITPDPTNSSKTAIDFKVPLQRMILYGLVAILLVGFFLYAFPEIGLLLPFIIIVTLYFYIVVNLNSQFYYLKWDVEQMEEKFKRQTVDL